MRRFFNYTVTLLSILIVLLIVSASYLKVSYADRFFPGVKVAGVDLSGKSEAEGEQAVQVRIDTYLHHPVKVVIPDTAHPTVDIPGQYGELEIPTTAGELGLQFHKETAVAAAWHIGHESTTWQWISEAVPHFFTGLYQPLTYRINPSAIDSFINTKVVPKIGTPIPAKVSVQGDSIVVTPPLPGFVIQKEALAHQLSTALQTASDNDTSYLRAPVSQVDSPITQRQVQPVADQLNSLGNLKLYLNYNSTTLSPSRTQLLTWFRPVQDDKGVVGLELQKEVIASYLNNYAALDQRNSLNALVAKINPLLTAPSVPQSIQVALAVKPPDPVPDASSATLGKFAGKYVEVNLATQRMFLVNGSTLEKTYVVSSGMWSTPTPVGVFSIHDKSPRAYSAAFGLYMPWWQDFLNGEYGLHELPEWPNGYKEGQAHLGIPVSHGCVRLGVGAAKEVYDWTDIGTPVYIH